MPRISVPVACVDCQEMFLRKELNRMGRCTVCATEAHHLATRQILGRKGPFYEKWRAAMRKAAGRL